MDAVLLARIQFAFAAGFHFLFPPTTFGLSFIILILEIFYYKTEKAVYKKLSTFLIKILGLVFVVGAATGITLEFAFGTNWSEYSRMVGDIFGAPLAAEGVFAFFMESIFLGILVFGREKVSKKMYLLSAFLVFFGSHLSGLWIIIANSFMQTPDGYEWIKDKNVLVLKDFFKAAVNHSTFIRYFHTLMAGWVTGAAFVAAIGSYYMLKGKYTEYAKKLVTVGLAIFICGSFLQLFLGHGHSVQVANTQPAKMAAFEGLWETQKNAPLSVFGIPDEEEEVTHMNIGIPGLLSLMVHMDTNGEIKGLKEFPKEDRPPVMMSFANYHIMIGLGMLFILISLIGAYLIFRRKLWESKWYLKLLLFTVPLPYIANETGWIAAEVGRQPWSVYGILRTADAASVVVPGWQVFLTLVLFVLVYALIFWAFMKVLMKIIRKGPEAVKAVGY